MRVTKVSVRAQTCFFDGAATDLLRIFRATTGLSPPSELPIRAGRAEGRAVAVAERKRRTPLVDLDAELGDLNVCAEAAADAVALESAGELPERTRVTDRRRRVPVDK